MNERFELRFHARKIIDLLLHRIHLRGRGAEHVVAIRAIRRNKGLVVTAGPLRMAWWLMRLAPGLFDWLMREGWRRR